ncbi:MAG: hypothetical protein ACI9OJ_005679, partial [Myxococcota bacterium]
MKLHRGRTDRGEPSWESLRQRVVNRERSVRSRLTNSVRRPSRVNTSGSNEFLNRRSISVIFGCFIGGS